MFFSKEINKTAFSFNNSEMIESIDSIEIYVYGSKKVPVCKKKKLNVMIQKKQYKNEQF